MTLSIDGRPGDVSRWVTCSADLKRRITTLRVLIADCDRMAAALDNEVRDEERLKKAIGEIERVSAELKLERAVADIDRIADDLRKAGGEVR